MKIQLHTKSTTLHSRWKGFLAFLLDDHIFEGPHSIRGVLDEIIFVQTLVFPFFPQTQHTETSTSINNINTVKIASGFDLTLLARMFVAFPTQPFFN